MFRVMGSMMPYRNRAYDIYRRNFSEASAVGFLSALLFTVFSTGVENLVDFGVKWMELTGIPYQMNIALLGFIVGYGTTKMFLLMRMHLFKMLLAYQGWMFNPKSTTTKMWALMLGLLRGNGRYPCFYFEPLLPRLPIPELNATLDRFLTSMKPIVPEEEYIQLLTDTETFRVKEGPKIHQYLKQRYYVQICDESLVPQYMQDLIPITMDGYKKTYCTVRRPKPFMDEIVSYNDQKHVVIYRKGVYFTMDVFKTDSDGKEVQVSVPEIHAQLQRICEMADDSKDTCPIGAREKLVAKDVNRESLEVIDSSLTIIFLDEERPKDVDEEAMFSMTGQGTNRCQVASGNTFWPRSSTMKMEVSPKPLRPLCRNYRHQPNLNGTYAMLKMKSLNLLNTSRNWRTVLCQRVCSRIMAKASSKPRGSVLMDTYRMFADGRTETIRPVTESSVAWCKAMSLMKGTTREQKILLLKRAINAQTKLKNEAVVGLGWDRHMFGLFACCKELQMELPSVFKNKYMFMPDVLSTSQTPTKYTDIWKQEKSCLGGGFAAVNPNGYGVSYIIVGEDLILFHVSANKYSEETSAHKMTDAIMDSMNEIRDLLN
ncbi:CPT1A-like protein [Mya arenaria]|uniref:CPT1A-like protein n=1 Tax=Mya arenaria TaxID=6604 RepID=A0ABY7FBL1_MYAAR|nr:CPT1A-like protein [Mya arenaria]